MILEGHADPRGSDAYNQALSERRVESTKRFLTGHGVLAADIRIKAVGVQQNLTEGQVREAVERNAELTSAQKQKMIEHMNTLLLASNRRVDITLSTTGQQSIRQFPFNAADSLSLLDPVQDRQNRGGARKKVRSAE